jgi:Sec-independent protein translocase protein TatA
MGFHMFDLIIVVVIGLAILGPKTFQSLARNAGKGVAQAKSAKDKIMAELPMEEIAKVTENIPQVPLNAQQAVRMLMTPEQKANSKKEPRPTEAVEKPTATRVDG